MSHKSTKKETHGFRHYFALLFERIVFPTFLRSLTNAGKILHYLIGTGVPAFHRAGSTTTGRVYSKVARRNSSQTTRSITFWLITIGVLFISWRFFNLKAVLTWILSTTGTGILIWSFIEVLSGKDKEPQA